MKCLENTFFLKNAKEILIITILAFLNMLSKYSSYIGIGLAIIEILYLFYLTIKKDFERYLLLFSVILFTSVEHVGQNNIDIYNFYKLPVLDGYHVYLLLIIPSFIIIAREGKKGICCKLKELNRFKHLKVLVISLSSLFVLGILSGFFGFIIDNNSVRSSGLFYLSFRRDIIHFGSIYLYILYLVYYLLNDKDAKNTLEKTILIVLSSMTIVHWITIVCGITGQYGDDVTSLVPLGVFFSPLLLLLPFKTKYENDISLLACGVLSIVAALILPSNLAGKWWIELLIIGVLLFYFVIKKAIKSDKRIVRIAMPIALILVIAISIFVCIKLIENPVVDGKLTQLLQLLNIFDPNWFNNLGASPRFRLDEFIAVFNEFIHQPLFFISGKGFGGGIVTTTDSYLWESLTAFSQTELDLGIYYNLHETVNILFLKFGVIGLGFFAIVIYYLLKLLNKDLFCVIGLFWFVFFLLNFYSLWIGAIALTLSIYYLDERSGVK